MAFEADWGLSMVLEARCVAGTAGFPVSGEWMCSREGRTTNSSDERRGVGGPQAPRPKPHAPRDNSLTI